MKFKVTFVLGGAASGKSAYAEKLVNTHALKHSADKIYLATSQVFDDEMRDKIADHVSMRGAGWHTIEAPFDLKNPLVGITVNQVVLLDCATMWLSNHLLKDHDIATEIKTLLTALRACEGHVVIVSNEVGMGIVPDNALARRFRNEQGRLNQQLAALSDHAVFVVAGQPLALKGDLA